MRIKLPALIVLVAALCCRCIAQSTQPDVASSITALGGSDAIAREAAIRQLSPLRTQAAPAIVDVFEKGSLSSRLACLELLKSWRAPIRGIDPWDHDSITAERIAALKAWAHQSATTAPATAQALDEEAVQREIGLMLLAGDEKESRIIRERLARTGASLLPMVRAQLKSAATDQLRQRLAALRYRLVASDELASSWIDGIERLASVEPPVRHAALDELGQRDGAESEAPLLLELFTDPDPMMREASLRLLHAAGSAESAAALVKLLHDPEPNVRAAVLKELAEKPSAEVVEAVAAYVATERDADLVVHAVRVLRNVESDDATECLKSLLVHENWRVRAEAAEAIGEKASHGGNLSDRAATYAAMIKLLDDPDGFVVSRAAIVLSKAQLATTIDPLMSAAERHPELAPELIRAITSDSSNAAAAVPHLNRLAKSPSPGIRAASIKALAEISPQSVPQIVEGLNDPEASVRTVSAWACLAAIETLKPEGGYITRKRWFGMGESREKVDMSKWYDDFRAGIGRPPWTAQIAPALEKMLLSDDPESRAAAASVLAALGEDQKALPVLLATVESKPALASEASRVLCWIPVERRIELARKLIELSPSDGGRRHILANLTEVPDPLVADTIWQMLAAEGLSIEAAGEVDQSLSRLYFGDQYYNPASFPYSARKPAIQAAREKLPGGTEMQRVVAMAILLRCAADEASTAAQQFLHDPASSDWLRTDALQILLLSTPGKPAEATAVKYAAHPTLRKVAVPFLAAGPSAIQVLRGQFGLNYVSGSVIEYGGESNPIVVSATAGLTREPLDDLLKNGDPAMQAYAGYLLVLLGDGNGMEPLIRFWRQRGGRDDDAITRLVYRAIAASNDESQIPILEEIYNSMDKTQTWTIRPFYWTIRSMTGDRILALRKKIRDEVGMERLR